MSCLMRCQMTYESFSKKISLMAFLHSYRRPEWTVLCLQSEPHRFSMNIVLLLGSYFTVHRFDPTPVETFLQRCICHQDTIAVLNDWRFLLPFRRNNRYPKRKTDNNGTGMQCSQHEKNHQNKVTNIIYTHHSIRKANKQPPWGIITNTAYLIIHGIHCRRWIGRVHNWFHNQDYISFATNSFVIHMPQPHFCHTTKGETSSVATKSALHRSKNTKNLQTQLHTTNCQCWRLGANFCPDTR